MAESNPAAAGQAGEGRQPLPGEASVLSRVAYTIGGGALVAAMLTDFFGVIGRHLGIQLIGVIEIVQYCIVCAVSAALVVATIGGTHAAVHILTERVSARARRALARFSEVLTVVFFVAVLAGDIWLASDVWLDDERSDLLGLPIAPARIIWCVSLIVALVLTIASVFRVHKEEVHGDL